MTIFTFFYILAGIIVITIGSKVFSMQNIDYPSYKKSVIKWKHFILAIIFGSLPFINFVLAITGVAMMVGVLISYINHQETWLDKPAFKNLFKRGNNERRK